MARFVDVENETCFMVKADPKNNFCKVIDSLCWSDFQIWKKKEKKKNIASLFLHPESMAYLHVYVVHENLKNK